MKALRNYIDKIKPNFQKGGKFEKLHSTFDAFETFLFVPNKVTTGGAHIRDAVDMKRTMALVVLAMVPALLFGVWNTGHQHFLALGEVKTFWPVFWYGFLQVFPIIVVSYVTGLGIEFAFAQVRGHEVNEGFLVTGMLIPLVVPVDVPLWMVAVATAFAVIIGKEVFGGTGMNILNPALTARAFLFFAYPAEMSGDKVWIAGLKNGVALDGFSGETILAQAAVGKTAFTNGLDKIYTTADMFFGTIPGSIGETSTLAILIGAAILIFTGIGSWKIMSSVFAGGLFMGLILNLFAINTYMEIPAWEHLMLGGFAFGAVFMATDPVTAAQTEKGKYIYGFLVGILAILVRVLNPAYPEGMMLAILLMNVFAPLIDHYVVEANIKRRLKRVKANVKEV
ncbi:MAG: NADH:ubiquinone reductase (Na(+)-transporting) subunit B [Bacteroidales bacterium]|nr:NADH:ubiquinone reductase (Na(+)-transporting) subunit B [Bacteroidales bacterium]